MQNGTITPFNQLTMLYLMHTRIQLALLTARGTLLTPIPLAMNSDPRSLSMGLFFTPSQVENLEATIIFNPGLQEEVLGTQSCLGQGLSNQWWGVQPLQEQTSYHIVTTIGVPNKALKSSAMQADNHLQEYI